MLTELVGQSFKIDNRSPEVFLETMLQAGGDPAYMQCVYNQLKLNIADAIDNAISALRNSEGTADLNSAPS